MSLPVLEVPSWFEQYATFLLRPSAFEDDDSFRRTLTQVVHAGLRWGGWSAVFGLGIYVGVEILILDRPVRWVHQTGFVGEEVALLYDLLLATLCVGAALLPAVECSLDRCRAWAAGALMTGAGVFLRSDIIHGTIQIEFVALLYLLVVVVVPFRPWQVVGIGGGIGGVFAALSMGLFVPDAAAAAVRTLPYVPSLGFATLLATLVSAVLYVTRLVQHQERQNAQAALRRSRDLLRRTQQVVGVGGWEYDPDTDTLWGTEQTIDLLNLPASADYDRETLIQAFDPDTRAELRAALRRCVTEGEPFDREFSRSTADGRRRWVRTQGELRAAESTETGTVRVAGTVQDITQQRQLEGQLREREEWLRSITDNVPDGICRSSPEKGLVYANQAFARMFGYDDPDDMIGFDPADLYVNSEAPVESARTEEKTPDSGGLEVELQRKDGSTFSGLLNRRKVLDAEGEIQYYDAIVTDITDQKEREEARRARRRKVEALYTATGHLLRAQDASAVAQLVHQLVAEEFGCTFGEVLFVDGERLVSAATETPDEWRASLPDFEVEGESLAAKAFCTGETIAVPTVEAAPNQHSYDRLQALAFVPVDSHGVVALGSVEVDGIPAFDQRLLEILATHAAVVLDRIEREQKLITAKEEAEEASRLKSALLANMSHEIRTPLTAINGFAEILIEEVEDAHADLAERIHRSGERLLNTLTSLVHLSKLEAGVADLDREPVQFGPAVEDAVAMLRSKATEKSLQVVTQLPEAPLEGRWNEWAVNRIVANLLENAIKFTPEGGQVAIRVAETRGKARLVVEDTGIGMSASFQETAFDAFQQESDGMDREYEGTGLGLSVISRLVEALDGAIELESERGEGTRVTVRLPLSSVPDSGTADTARVDQPELP